MITENLSTLKINKLSEEQFKREAEAGNIDETAFYLTPDNSVGGTVKLDNDLILSGDNTTIIETSGFVLKAPGETDGVSFEVANEGQCLRLMDSYGDGPVELTGIATPIYDSSAVNKKYVDNNFVAIGSGLNLDGNDINNVNYIYFTSGTIKSPDGGYINLTAIGNADDGNESLVLDSGNGLPRISDVADPVNSQDVATKSYVDENLDTKMPLSGTVELNDNLILSGVDGKISLDFGRLSLFGHSSNGMYFEISNEGKTLTLQHTLDDSSIELDGIATPTTTESATNKGYVDNAIQSVQDNLDAFEESTNSTLGDIETALDAIIAMQQNLIGGTTE